VRTFVAIKPLACDGSLLVAMTTVMAYAILLIFKFYFVLKLVLLRLLNFCIM
jgi:hypothetical protein